MSYKDFRNQTEKSRLDIGFLDRFNWRNAKANFSEKTLEISGHPVMEDWETPYMEKLAKIATLKGGVVLEVGFGMGISAQFIQENKIEKHIIIEANSEVAKKAYEFVKAAKCQVIIMEGFWEDVIFKIPDESLDGILFDTYPLSKEEIHKNHFTFFRGAFQKLKTGGVLTYYSDEIDSYGVTHMNKLLEAGFQKEKIQSEVIFVDTPPDCKYWKGDKILAPIIYK
jgi:guanidinoacetate N-methyltransferase